VLPQHIHLVATGTPLVLLLPHIFNSDITNVELPFFTDPSAYSYARYGQGSGPIYLSYVSCTGRESSLLDCQYYRDEI